jgi:DHA1 family multidrug resistance protein-like MFS transporter
MLQHIYYIPNSLPLSDESLSRVATHYSLSFTEASLEADERHNIEKVKSIPIVPKRTKDGAILVDWY